MLRYTGYLEKNKFMIGGSQARRSHTAIGMRTQQSPKMVQFVHGIPERCHTAAGIRQPNTNKLPGYAGFKII
jgi:hypothetical protein